MSQRPPRRSRWTGLALRLLLVVALCELTLQLVAAVSPPIRWLLTPVRTGFVDDPELGQRGDPANPRHDAWGFSNVHVPSSAPIVAVGDSQTYGISVAREEAWPQVLSERLSVPVYNSGIPAGGPVQYRVAAEQATTLSPKLVLVALYAGNDIADTLRDVFHRGLGADLSDEALEAEYRQLEEAHGPLLEDITELFRKTNGRRPDGAWEWFVKRVVAPVKVLGLGAAVVRAIGAATKPPPLTGDAAWKAQLAKAEARAGYVSVVETPRARTILTAPYRAAAMGLSERRLAIGAELTLRAIARIQAACEAARCDVLVLQVPTKELVFAPLVDDATRHPGLDALIAAETGARAWFSERLTASGVAVVDALPALRATLLDGSSSPYAEDPDGHPNAVGNAAIASWLATLPQVSALRP